jgi:preprotein translocase subunit Sss1
MVLRSGREPDDDEWEFLKKASPWMLVTLGVLGLVLFGAGIWQQSWSMGVIGFIIVILEGILYVFFLGVKESLNNDTTNYWQ